MACEWLLTCAYMFPNSRWFIARQELTRLKKSTFVTFKKVCRYHNIPDEDWRLDGQNNIIVFTNGSTIDLIDVAFKPTDPDYERFGSLEYTGGFGEEVHNVAQEHRRVKLDGVHGFRHVAVSACFARLHRGRKVDMGEDDPAEDGAQRVGVLGEEEDLDGGDSLGHDT